MIQKVQPVPQIRRDQERNKTPHEYVLDTEILGLVDSAIAKFEHTNIEVSRFKKQLLLAAAPIIHPTPSLSNLQFEPIEIEKSDKDVLTLRAKTAY